MIDDLHGFAAVVAVLVVGLPAVVGVVLILTGVRRWMRARSLTAAGVPTVGVVVDNQQESASEGRIRFLPVVRFQTGTGQEVRTVLQDLAGYRSHLAGTEYKIVYDPENPQRSTVAGGKAGNLIGALVAGLIFLAFAVVAFFIAGSVVHGFDSSGMP